MAVPFPIVIFVSGDPWSLRLTTLGERSSPSATCRKAGDSPNNHTVSIAGKNYIIIPVLVCLISLVYIVFVMISS